jgi:hypothetical protein
MVVGAWLILRALLGWLRVLLVIFPWALGFAVIILESMGIGVLELEVGLRFYLSGDVLDGFFKHSLIFALKLGLKYFIFIVRIIQFLLAFLQIPLQTINLLNEFIGVLLQLTIPYFILPLWSQHFFIAIIDVLALVMLSWDAGKFRVQSLILNCQVLILSDNFFNSLLFSSKCSL